MMTDMDVAGRTAPSSQLESQVLTEGPHPPPTAYQDDRDVALPHLSPSHSSSFPPDHIRLASSWRSNAGTRVYPLQNSPRRLKQTVDRRKSLSKKRSSDSGRRSFIRRYLSPGMHAQASAQVRQSQLIFACAHRIAVDSETSLAAWVSIPISGSAVE
jgi:hypothetical protein